MSDLDPQITTILLPTPDEAGDWGRVLADAGTIKQPRHSLLRSHRLALAFIAVAALTKR
jgi:hypothetical protein